MRRRLGRPDISAYEDLFRVPAALDDGLAVTFVGVSTLLFDDGASAVMFDGFFSRPSLATALLRKVRPDLARIDAALDRLGFSGTGRSLDAVLPVHSHFDHVMDSAVVADRTGAVLVGGESTANVGRGAGLDPRRIHVVTPGVPEMHGSFTLTHVLSAHCPPDRFPGVIDAPLTPPVKVGEYKCGEAWSVLVEHTSGTTALVQGSAGYVPGALDDRRADVAYLGIGQLGHQPEQYVRDYWDHTVRAVGARRVVLTHWDDFFRPVDEPLRALPYLGDDLDATMSVLKDLAASDGRHLEMPSVWRRENPWESTT